MTTSKIIRQWCKDEDGAYAFEDLIALGESLGLVGMDGMRYADVASAVINDGVDLEQAYQLSESNDEWLGSKSWKEMEEELRLSIRNTVPKLHEIRDHNLVIYSQSV